MTESMVERVARALMEVTAKRPGSGGSAFEYPVLSDDPDFDDLPIGPNEGTPDDAITQEAVLALARAAISATGQALLEEAYACKFSEDRHGLMCAVESLDDALKS